LLSQTKKKRLITVVWQKYRHKPLYYNSTFVQGGTSPSHKMLAAIKPNT